jgi:hypothetical protein
MILRTLAAPSSPVNLNGPGTYLHWNIFYVSLANLVLIAVMVLIFAAALLLPFPGRRRAGASAAVSLPEVSLSESPRAGSESPDDDMWTARVRNRALRLLPPGKLLPDRQPAYVASWIYVFGVASLAALGMAIVSGLVIAVGGVDWWHTNPVGHFFNSMHLWSVELFMALIVIHLWGKFWMAAWRGRRAMTWITGVVAFLASIVECFTGYLSQQNFDSQWISTSGKDAFNSVGVGAFFNLMNFGQMLLWHVVLIPVILIAIVGAHVLLVRVRGVAPPIDAHRAEAGSGSWLTRRRAISAAEAAPWRGPTRRYDIIKEGSIAVLITLALTLGLAGLLSSPDVPALTVQTWSRLDPSDFLATAGEELNATSETATYGQPYNTGSAFVQKLLFSPQTWFGVTEPISAPQAFVLQPLASLAPTDPALASALSTYNGAPASQRLAWASAYLKAITPKVTMNATMPVIPAANDGPVPTMLAAELSMARSGALDTDLLAGRTFYGTNFTKPLLFIEDGAYFPYEAGLMNLSGGQWGVMNETGGYPGQPWLWLYTLWYQVPHFRTSANVDMIAIYLTGLATILLLLVPFVPGLRDIPRLIPVHRLIWRNWEHPAGSAITATPAPSPGTAAATGADPPA